MFFPLAQGKQTPLNGGQYSGDLCNTCIKDQNTQGTFVVLLCRTKISGYTVQLLFPSVRKQSAVALADRCFCNSNSICEGSHKLHKALSNGSSLTIFWKKKKNLNLVSIQASRKVTIGDFGLYVRPTLKKGARGWYGARITAWGTAFNSN